jgi:uncharacterized damage-inducible protein DinB
MSEKVTKEKNGLEKFADMVVEKLGAVLKPETKLEEEAKLAQMTLEGGAVVEAEAFEEGQRVFVLAEGERIPAPVGDHRLEDGRILVVREEGIIAGITEAEMEEEVEAKGDHDEERMSKLEAAVSELAKKFQDFTAAKEEEKAELSKVVEEKDKELEEVKAQLSEEPVSEGPIVAPVESEAEEVDFSKMTRQERLMHKIAKNLK